MANKNLVNKINKVLNRPTTVTPEAPEAAVRRFVSAQPGMRRAADKEVTVAWLGGIVPQHAGCRVSSKEGKLWADALAVLVTEYTKDSWLSASYAWWKGPAVAAGGGLATYHAWIDEEGYLRITREDMP